MSKEYKHLKQNYHAASWEEPLIMEQGRSGERGILMPASESEVKQVAGDVMGDLPAGVRRNSPLQLPELSQPQVLRHYMRLSQMCLGVDLNIDISEGTCTMKYSPKVDEVLARSPQLTEMHPYQDDDTAQGILEIMYQFGEMMKEISGMDYFTFQPSAGGQGIYTNACLIRAYHAARGELEQRNEIITTIFSHPTDAATPATAGFKVITLMPDENGYPDLDALKSVVSERTAGLMITNPEDTGIYNPRIKEYVDLIHSVGGLCSYDQANANGILGICRAREAGFDMCHFNLHKTFSSPHGCMGPACGAVGVREHLMEFLPVPVVRLENERYYLDYDLPNSIGKVRSFMGNAQVVLRAYAWVMSLGAEGLRQVAHTAVLNNNYLAKQLSGIPGIDIYYAKGKRRLDQIRYSWNSLTGETGVGTSDIKRRIVDFGVQGYHESHHPYIVPEPFTLEPTETFSKADIDEYAEILRHVAEEARENPEFVKSAPHNNQVSLIDGSVLSDPQKWAMTYRAYRKKKANW